MVKISIRSSMVESFKVMDVLQRANELQNDGYDVLHCEVGQPESGAPALVSQAAVTALTATQPKQILGYTDAFGLLSLREKIVQHYITKYSPLSTELSTSRIIITTGSSGAFLLAFTACFDSNDVVAIASSGYPCYRNILLALGCQLTTISINTEFKLTSIELQTEIIRRQQCNLPSIKGLILSSPSNPTGAMLSPIELQQLCNVCDTNNITFISDEIYHGISYGHQKEATAIQYSNNAIIINSFSKYYSMSGWRLGWMIIPNELIQPINVLQQNMFINAPTISQVAALQCWEPDTILELEQHVIKYKHSRSIILDSLKQIKEISITNIAPADGGFYIYIDLGIDNVFLPEYGSVKMCQLLLEEYYVAMTPGTDFEDPTTNHGNCRFRISYAGGINTVQNAMERFLQFFPTWIQRVTIAKNNSTANANTTTTTTTTVASSSSAVEDATK